MKRICLFFILLVLALLSVSARPQFFFGTGAGWGRFYPSGDNKNELVENRRYGSDVYYLSYIVPQIEFTVIPYADFPLGVSVRGGYGFISGNNNGKTSTSYAYKTDGSYNYSDNYRYGADDVISLSGGLIYNLLVDREKHFSFVFSSFYTFQRFNLNSIYIEKGTRVKDKDKESFDVHSVSLDFGIMGRYDKSYFKIDCDVSKALNPEKGIASLFDGDGYCVTVVMTIGIVFTFLSSNQFMR